MFVFTIILGLYLYPGHCYKTNDAISTRRQARNSQLYYNIANGFNYQPTQDIYYINEASQNSNNNYAPSQNSNNNYAPSQNNKYNYAPRENSNYNYELSQNSDNNYAPSQNSNKNYALSQNSNYNYEPSQNNNHNYAPSQNENHNSFYGNITYAEAGYRGQSFPNDRSVYLTKIITSQPYENEKYNSQLDQLSRGHQTIINIDSYRDPIAYNAEIGGTPVPMFREYPNYRQFDELPRDHQIISNINRYYPIPHSAAIGGKAVPVIIDYPKFRSLPPVNVTTYPNLPSTPIPFPPFENNPRISPGNNLSQNEKVLGFSDIESRNKNMTAIATSPDSLGFDNPGPREMVEQQFLWQMSVFSKEVSPRVRVCGGSLVTSSTVISAARCFWSVGPLSGELFAVGAGEAASGQANNYEAYQYQINVRDISLPPRFRGATSSFQDDLAVVVLARPLPPALTPVCVSFDWELEEQQLAKGSEGTVLKKVERWNLDMRNQRVPYIGIKECLRETPEDQLRHVTSDKFCAGFRGVSDRACTPDTGSGLVSFQGSSIPFLRGVASLSLGDSCVTVFTHVGRHRAFLLRHVSGLEAECARHYPGTGGAVKKGGGEEFVCNCYC